MSFDQKNNRHFKKKRRLVSGFQAAYFATNSTALTRCYEVHCVSIIFNVLISIRFPYDKL
ncbi:hypothetical protein UUU_27710 [Klebsiella pneumoniae subsp. pneumoniae DSM 30104 = JCM 1662 = NBRC 14940]|nr:hypothetical protein UUU_27710 [Klebsiella pneumoniae subsp. pneumoniae DSM 30104 = JCM 1662 = NBRC 14940]